jgi:dienelactone hydrolase
MRRGPLLALLLFACTPGDGGDDSLTTFVTTGGPTGPAPTTGDPGGPDPGTSTATTDGPAITTTSDPATTDATTTSTTTVDPDTSLATTDPPATTDTGDDTTGGPVDPNVNVDPSNGMGGTIAPGASELTPLGAEIYVPSTYDPQNLASPVIWLFNETIPQWQSATQADAAILVDLHEYNDTQKIVDKLNETQAILEPQYNVDKARYYWAGWSAGGNLVVIIGSMNQDTIAGTMAFPGTGGNIAQPAMEGWNGHKIRLYYACGSEDPNFAWMNVENEANFWKNSYGYETRFDLVQGAPHYIDEAVYMKRVDGWAWMRNFNQQN